jgi:hypothetical protein
MDVSGDDICSPEDDPGGAKLGSIPRRKYTTMRIKLNYVAPLLAAGAAAVAIAAAPMAAAAPTGTGQDCSGNVCQSPGNVQINDSPPPVSYSPYGDMPYLLGGHGGLRGGR